MLAIGREELICDLAESYGVLDMGTIPVPLLATLACGLRDHSRIKMKISGVQYSPMDLLVAAAVDRLSILTWQNTTDSARGINTPKSILAIMLDDVKDGSDVQGFDTAEEFEAAWAKMTGVEHGG